MFNINTVANNASAIARAVIDNGNGPSAYPASPHMASPGVWSRSPK